MLGVVLSKVQPHFKSREMVGKETRGLIGFGLSDDTGQLLQEDIQHLVPCLPHRMVMRAWQRRMRLWRALGIAQDAIGQEKVAEQTGHDRILTEESLELLGRN